MQDSKQLELALKTLAATIFLGVAGDLLLRDVPWGIGFSIYAFVIFAVGAYLFRSRTVSLGRGVLWVIPPALLFASLFAWRDSNDLKILNGISFSLLVGVFALRARQGQIGTATLIDYPLRLVERWACFLTDFFDLARLEGNGKLLGQMNLGKKLASWTGGALIAAPLLLVFGVLFASSDAVFSHFAMRAVSFDPAEIVSHLGVFAASVWIVGGFFRRIFHAPDSRPDSQLGRIGPKLGITEITIVLSTLNALFLSFVAIQFRYLFGGAELVQRTAHLSYAEYARQGFFELVLAAFLGLVVVVAGHNLLKKENRSEWISYASLSFTLVCLIFVVMASAFTRMQLYVAIYGITRERLYVVAILFWLAFVLSWFCATTLRGRSSKFSAGALASLLIVVLALNLLNPDAYIAKLNTSRALKSIDADYLVGLSNDAIPQLLKSLPSIPLDAREKVLSSLQRRKERMDKDDWRSWDLSSETAISELNRRR